MNFTHHDLGHRSGGEIVRVTLSGNSANVRLMDSSNFQKYRTGKKHRFLGGHAKRSPIDLKIPHSGHWHVAVDLGGYRGRVNSSVQILPGALRPIQNVPLSSIPALVHGRYSPIDSEQSVDDAREFDVFISHASEDKDEVVRPLAHALQSGGLRVWYDEFELKIGDSLRRKIDRGLSASHFGVVVLSKDFFKKGWPNYELDGLVTRSTTGDQVLLPIWHNITKQEVINYSPSLADKLARNTTINTVAEIANEIIEVISQS